MIAIRPGRARGRRLDPGTAVRVRVGGDERPVFLSQPRLHRAWGTALTVVPGRCRFDVIEPLPDPDSLPASALRDGLSR